MHRLHHPGLDESALEHGGVLDVGGEEGRHAAKVKRLGHGEMVEVLNGAGLVVRGRAAEVDPRGGRVSVEVDGWSRVPRVRPRVDVAAPPPKGERLERMLDQLGQLGAASWVPLRCERSVREPARLRFDRLERVTAATMKQCGRAYAMEIGAPIEFGSLVHGLCVVADRGDGARRGVLARADGAFPAGPGRPAGESVVVIVGPEGGLSDRELGLAEEAGVGRLRLGPHVLRTETAAAAAAAVLLADAGPCP